MSCCLKKRYRRQTDLEPCCVIYVSVPSACKAKAIAKKLLEECKIACATLLPESTNFFLSKGCVRDFKEAILLCKTTRRRTAEAIEMIAQLHPYDMCEVFSLPMECGNEAYFGFIAHAVRGKAGQSDEKDPEIGNGGSISSLGSPMPKTIPSCDIPEDRVSRHHHTQQMTSAPLQTRKSLDGGEQLAGGDGNRSAKRRSHAQGDIRGGKESGRKSGGEKKREPSMDRVDSKRGSRSSVHHHSATVNGDDTGHHRTPNRKSGNEKRRRDQAQATIDNKIKGNRRKPSSSSQHSRGGTVRQGGVTAKSRGRQNQ